MIIGRIHQRHWNKTQPRRNQVLAEGTKVKNISRISIANASGKSTAELQVVSVQKFRASRELASRASSGAFLTAATFALASARVATE